MEWVGGGGGPVARSCLTHMGSEQYMVPYMAGMGQAGVLS